jgi:hypothetical protein
MCLANFGTAYQGAGVCGRVVKCRFQRNMGEKNQTCETHQGTLYVMELGTPSDPILLLQIRSEVVK